MPIPERVTPAREKCNAPIASKCGRPSFPAPSWLDRFPSDPPPPPSFRAEQADFSSRFAPAKRSACAERNLSSSPLLFGPDSCLKTTFPTVTIHAHGASHHPCLLPQCALFPSRWFYRGALENCSCTTFHSSPCLPKTCVPLPRILRAFCLVLPGRPRPSCTLQ